MRATYGIALMMALAMSFATGQARGDTCWNIPGVQTVDCNAPEGSAKQTPSPAAGQSDLRDKLRRSLTQGAANRQAVQAASARVQDASARIGNDLAQAKATNDPATLARLRADLSVAMSDYRSAIGDLIAADPQDRGKLQDLQRTQEALAMREAASAGLAEPPAPAPATPTPAPTEYAVCGDPDSGGRQSCYEVPPRGSSCAQTIRLDGDTVWSNQLAVCDRPELLSARDAFFKAHPEALTDAPTPFEMDPGQTRREVDRMLRAPQPGAEMPASCRPGFEKFLAASRNGSVGSNDAVQAYAALDAVPQCHDALRQAAASKDLDLPVRHLDPRTRSAFEAAMAADPSSRPGTPFADGGSGGGNGFDPAEVIDFGMALLGAFGGGHVPSVRAVRVPTPTVRTIVPRTPVPTYTFTWPPPRTNQPTITGIGLH